MEFRKDLLETGKKSIMGIIAGVFFLAISTAWVTINIIENEVIRPFDWFYFFAMLINGIVHTIQGAGIKLGKLFGKAFVVIDNECIALKPGIYNKEQRVYWSDIKTIHYEINKCRILNKDGSNQYLDLSKFNYGLKQTIKDAIAYIAKEKNIEATI